jgi:hypothetical protein
MLGRLAKGVVLRRTQATAPQAILVASACSTWRASSPREGANGLLGASLCPAQVAQSNEAHPPSKLPGRGPAGRCMAHGSPAAQARQLVRNARGAGKRGRPAQPAQLMRLFFFLFLPFSFYLFISSLSRWTTKLVH